MNSEAARGTARAWIEAHRGELAAWHEHIWALAEPAWRERASAAWYVERLRAEGFEVEEGSAGMPTAFRATWSNGAGPTLLTYAEYDAVPGNCQAAEPRPEPRPGLGANAPGHTDPHSALGIATLAGLLATKQAMQEHGIRGTLRYTGEPAEKMQGSKVVHGLRGAYDGVDAIVSFHPFYMLPLCNTARWDTQCGAYFSKVYSFVCDEPESWQSVNEPGSPIPASHSAARAPGANMALSTMFLTSKGMQDSMLPAHGGWSLSEAILTDGQATADNLPARTAHLQYSWRCPTVEAARQIERVLDTNAEHAAALAHCRLAVRTVSRTRPGITNHVLAEALYDELEQVGAPAYGAEAVAFAQEIQKSLDLDETHSPFLDETTSLLPPREAERRLREHLPAWQRNWTSDDYVEMTHYAPTVRFYVARPALAPRADGKPYPGWVMNALGGYSPAILPTIEVAGATIAGTFLRLLTSPDVLAAAQAEFTERREATGNLPPLLDADFEPPIDLSWPDYTAGATGERVWP